MYTYSYIPIADSYCWTSETNTTVWNNYIPINKFKNQEKLSCYKKGVAIKKDKILWRNKREKSWIETKRKPEKGSWEKLLFIQSVVSNSLRPHRLQHARLPCLSLAQTHVHWVHDTIQPSHTLLLLPSIFPGIRVFSSESALCIWWPKYWSFSTSISPANEYSGLISFRIDWLDLFVVQWEKCSYVNDYFCHG